MRRIAWLAVGVIGLCAGHARADAAEPAAAETLDDKKIQQNARQAVTAMDSQAFSDNPQWSAAAAVGTEFGIGTVIPSLHAPAYVLQGRLGFSIRTPSTWTIVLAGQIGVNMAFNAGDNATHYGYVVRVPLDATVETIYSHILDYAHRRYINIHTGILGGPDFLLAAQCQFGNCNYVQPAQSFGMGMRVGTSFSAGIRSAFGLFVTYQVNFADCSINTSNNACETWVSTLVWTLGWTLF